MSIFDEYKERKKSVKSIDEQKMQERAAFLTVFFLAAFIGALFVLFIFRISLIEPENELINVLRRNPVPIIISVIAFLISIFSIYRYLTIEYNERNVSVDNGNKIKEIAERITTLENGTSDSQLDQYVKSIEKIKLGLNSKNKDESDAKEKLLTTIHEDFNSVILKEAKLDNIISYAKDTPSRIIGEINRLTRRANINLSVGAISTVFAIGILAFGLFSSKLVFESNFEFLTYFIPRVSLIVVLELFAFFFLRSYRINMNDIKYFHNELTNIETKIVALKAAFSVGEEFAKEVIRELNSTERNFILKKDESTIDLEKSKLDLYSDKSTKELLKELLKLKGS